MRKIFFVAVGTWLLLGSENLLRFAQASEEIPPFRIGQVATARFNSLLQVWEIGNENTNINSQLLRLRRMELRMNTQIADASRITFMLDPARLIPPRGGNSVPVLIMVQDLNVSYTLLPGLEITLGQFKIPTTADGLDSSADLPLPERSLEGRTYGDRREMGIKLGYRKDLWNVTAMLSSGRPMHVDGAGMFHDLDLRAELTPSKNFTVGGFAVLGNDFDYSAKGRWGVNGRYEVAGFSFRGEYAQAKDGATHGHGTSTEVGYWINQKLEPLFRYETFVPNQSSANAGKAETAGLSYWIRDYNLKFQLAGSILQNMVANNGSPGFSAGVNNRLVTVVVQASI